MLKDNCFWEEGIKKYEKTQTQNSVMNFYWKLQDVVPIYRQNKALSHWGDNIFQNRAPLKALEGTSFRKRSRLQYKI